ncbi:MAG: cation:proton antiporter [Hyphomicrobiaceae bacterium]
MAATGINIDAYIDALLVLGTAGVVVPLVRRFGGSAVLGYLAAGALLGPLGLGSLKYQAPVLLWMTVADSKNVAGIAELGVVFLLFLIGLELSFARLMTMRRLVFGLGGLQVVISAAVIACVALLAGARNETALIIGLCLALSSTAIVLDVLSSRKRLATSTGRVGFSVLLAQDLAVVPLFLVIAILSAADGGGSALNGLARSLFDASVALLLIVVAGRFLLRPLLQSVAAIDAPELFTAATLFIVVAAGVIAAIFGLSMALGAFIAGLLLAETEFRKSIETIIEPFKAILLGVFFFTIGMKIDVRELLAHPMLLVLSVVALVTVKAAIAYGLMRLFRVHHVPALEAAFVLGPGGEFAFVGLGLAVAAGIVQHTVSSFVIAVTAFSMALIPLLFQLAARLAGVSEDTHHVEPPPQGEEGHVIIVGCGRFGRLVSEMLTEHKLSYLAIDSDAAAVAVERSRGNPVYFGNAVDRHFLERCGLAKARALVLTVHDQAALEQMVLGVRERYPGITIVARARDAAHASHLYSLDVTDAVPETIEASLQLSEAVLVGLGMPAGPIIASIHEKRDQFRHALQDAASKAGKETVHSIRSSTLRR